MSAQERTHPMTVEEFEAFVQLPENADKTFEYVKGEVYEVPSNPFVSKIASIISGYLFVYLMQNDIGHITGEAGGYRVMGERYAPDVAFIRYEKQPELAKKGYNPAPPDLAVEVISSESKAEEDRLTVKLSNYLAAGTIVWIVRPEAGEIEVHDPAKGGRIVKKDAEQPVIDGGDLLPGFTLNVAQVLKSV